MRNRLLLIGFGLILIASQATAITEQSQSSEVALYKKDFALQFNPDYPPFIGQPTEIILRPFKPAEKVAIFSDRDQEVPLKQKNGRWTGKYLLPSDYQEGGHYFTVYIRYPADKVKKLNWWEKHLLRKKEPGRGTMTKVWYQAFKPKEPQYKLELFELKTIYDTASVEVAAISSDELTAETGQLEIKGSQSITFKSRTLSGSREGEAAGSTQSREETLRVNVKGRSAGTDIEASLFRSSATGVARVGDQEEQVSILMRHGSTEAYLGDFTADFKETEFARLDKVLSGGRAKGDYGNWGFNVLYSSPKGQQGTPMRRYGDGTQGPYQLADAPVVINSERVFVDGVLLTRGEQYSIDYQAGTITFLKQVVNQRSIIQVYYDYRQTLYAHNTYGLRTYYQPSGNLKVAATYLDDSDSLTGAAEIHASITGEAVEPQGHRLLGVDADYVSNDLTLAAEAAISAKNTNLLGSGSEQIGKAVKISLTTSLGEVGLTGHAKKVGASFLPVADPDPEQDVWAYGYGLSYRPNSLLALKGDQEYKQFVRGGVYYLNQQKGYKVNLTPERWPSLEYNYSETDDNNDPVSGSPIERKITRNSAESLYRFSFWQTSLKGSREHWLNRTPSEEATDYQRINVGLATAGLEQVTFSSNLELEDRREPSGSAPNKKTFNLNLAASPDQNYFAASSLNVVDDSSLGRTEVVELSYRAQPDPAFKTDGKYSISSLDEEFSTTSEGVSRQSGSFSFDYRPWQEIRLRYLYKPNFTLLSRTGGRIYNNEQQQTEITLLPTKQMLVGAVYKLGNSFNIYRNNYPNYSVKENTDDTSSSLYTLKLAPWTIFSTEFNWLHENLTSTDLTATQEPWTYLAGRGETTKFDASIKSSLSERFSLDTRYTYEKVDLGSGEASSNLTDTKSHTALIKGLWNCTDNWTFSVQTSYARTANNLAGTLTYTLTPGAGLIYRQGDELRVDLDYTRAQSYSGAETVVEKYSLRAKYAVSQFVDATLRAEQENSRAPDYQLCDLTANIEIRL